MTGCAGSVANVRWCDTVRVPGGRCDAGVEAWNGRRGQGVMTGPVCEECEQVQQRCRRQTSAPGDESRSVALVSGRRARRRPRTRGTSCRSSAMARSGDRAAMSRRSVHKFTSGEVFAVECDGRSRHRYGCGAMRGHRRAATGITARRRLVRIESNRRSNSTTGRDPRPGDGCDNRTVWTGWQQRTGSRWARRYATGRGAQLPAGCSGHRARSPRPTAVRGGVASRGAPCC